MCLSYPILLTLSQQIEARLRKVNEALKKYKHVNKKAFDQYNSFTAQREQLLKRREELDTSRKSIMELIEHLDREKDEAIERTFKQVSKEFATIFEKLVPAGHGRLVIQRRTDKKRLDKNAAGDEESDREDGPTSGVDSYTGVGISVSFNSKVADEQQKIQQLSGGQKSESFQFHGESKTTALTSTTRLVRTLPDLRSSGSRVQPVRHFR